MIFSDYEKLENLVGFTYFTSLAEDAKNKYLKEEKEAYDILSKTLDTEHLITLDLEASIGTSEYLLGLYSEAEKHLSHSFNCFITKCKIPPIKLFKFSAALFFTLFKMDKKEEALDCLTNTLSFVMKNYELKLNEEIRLLSSFSRIRSMLLISLNKTEEAILMLENEFKNLCLKEGLFSFKAIDSLMLYIQALEASGNKEILEELILDVKTAAKIEKPESIAMDLILDYFTKGKEFNIASSISKEDKELINKLVLHILGFNNKL